MIAAIVALVLAILGFAVWAMTRGDRRERPGPDNNWQNEDYTARDADGTWSEGSTYEKSKPGNGMGWPW